MVFREFEFKGHLFTGGNGAAGLPPAGVIHNANHPRCGFAETVNVFGTRFKDEDGVAKRELGSANQRHFTGEGLAVDERAVFAIEVAEIIGAIFKKYFGMMAGYFAVNNLNGV